MIPIHSIRTLHPSIEEGNILSKNVRHLLELMQMKREESGIFSFLKLLLAQTTNPLSMKLQADLKPHNNIVSLELLRTSAISKHPPKVRDKFPRLPRLLRFQVII